MPAGLASIDLTIEISMHIQFLQKFPLIFVPLKKIMIHARDLYHAIYYSEVNSTAQEFPFEISLKL